MARVRAYAEEFTFQYIVSSCLFVRGDAFHGYVLEYYESNAVLNLHMHSQIPSPYSNQD